MGILENVTPPGFDLERVKVPKLIAVAYRVPYYGELYLDKNNKLQRLKQDRVQSKRAKPRLILLETML